MPWGVSILSALVPLWFLQLYYISSHALALLLPQSYPQVRKSRPTSLGCLLVGCFPPWLVKNVIICNYDFPFISSNDKPVWSSSMILALDASGPGFNSQRGPLFWRIQIVHNYDTDRVIDF